MARAVPGAQLTPDEHHGPNDASLLAPAPTVRPQYFLDGMYMSNFNIDDMPARDVEGVELYAGFAGLPQEFAKQMGVQACGAVIIWTRIPGT